MKILTAKNIYFQLPDRFKGTVPDALRLLAKYLETETPPLKDRVGPDPKNEWEEFLDVLGRGGRLFGHSTVQKLLRGKTWEIVEDAGKPRT